VGVASFPTGKDAAGASASCSNRIVGGQSRRRWLRGVQPFLRARVCKVVTPMPKSAASAFIGWSVCS
jgi:hypothetical protein